MIDTADFGMVTDVDSAQDYQTLRLCSKLMITRSEAVTGVIAISGRHCYQSSILADIRLEPLEHTRLTRHSGYLLLLVH